jgi:hypothetical protein
VALALGITVRERSNGSGKILRPLNPFAEPPVVQHTCSKVE